MIASIINLSFWIFFAAILVKFNYIGISSTKDMIYFALIGVFICAIPEIVYFTYNYNQDFINIKYIRRIFTLKLSGIISMAIAVMFYST